MSQELGRTIESLDYSKHTSSPSTRYAEQKHARRNRPIRVDEEKKPLIQNLAQEVRDIHLRGEDGLYLLPGTGFHVTTEIENFLRNMEKGVFLVDCFRQVEQNVQAFKIEYLVEGPVFPIALEKKLLEGKTRLVGKLYGGGLWLDATSDIERDGVVREVVERLENEIIDAKPGDLFVKPSLKGWSGYQLRGDALEKENEEDIALGIAKKVKYPDTQIYCIQIQPDGSIRGFTLKNNMDFSQTETFMMRLGVPGEVFEEQVDEKTGIKRLLRSAVKVSSEKHKDIESVAKEISQVTGSDVLYKDTLEKERTSSEMMAILENPEHLWTLDETLTGFMDVWKEYAKLRLEAADSTTTLDLKVSLGYTVMQLMHRIRPPVTKHEMVPRNKYRVVERYEPVFDPRQTLEDMQKIAGCAGGGIAVSSAGSSRKAVIVESDENGPLEVNCPDCGAMNKRSRNGWIYECGGCGSTKIACGRKREEAKRPAEIEGKRKCPPAGEAGKRQTGEEEKAA